MIAGLLPVLETPFLSDGSIDVPGFVAVIVEQKRAGADGVMFAGFASEFSRLSDSERTELETVMLSMTAGVAGFTGVISVSDQSTHLATRRATRAAEGGADAINILPPYLGGPSPSEVIHHLDAVLDAAGETPVIVQLAPALTATVLTAADVARLARRHGNLVAVKVESTPPGPVVSALLSGEPPLPSVVGYAGLHLIDALDRGAVGVQPGSSFPALYRAILDSWASGDAAGAARQHERLLPYLAYWMQSVDLIVQVEKAISFRRGLISTDLCRRPGRALDETESAMIDRFLSLFATELTA